MTLKFANPEAGRQTTYRGLTFIDLCSGGCCTLSSEAPRKRMERQCHRLHSQTFPPRWVTEWESGGWVQDIEKGNRTPAASEEVQQGEQIKSALKWNARRDVFNALSLNKSPPLLLLHFLLNYCTIEWCIVWPCPRFRKRFIAANDIHKTLGLIYLVIIAGSQLRLRLIGSWPYHSWRVSQTE